MRWHHILIFLLSIGLSQSVLAEFYQYTDENGVIRFTDSYVDVPLNQRKKVKRFEEPDDRLTSEQIAERERLRKEQADKAAAELKTEERLKLRKSLNQRKVTLDRETEQLAKEQKALEKEKETVSMSDFAQAKAYRDKVTNFNQRLVEHQQRQKDFNAQVETFNEEERAVAK